MAENIYSKGTRVWFTDKEQGWISAEVTNILRGSDEKVKLTFVDERGKVSPRVSFYHRRNLPHSNSNLHSRKTSSTLLSELSKRVKMTYHHYEILLYWRPLTTSPRYPILMSLQVRFVHPDSTSFLQFLPSSPHHS